MTAARSRPKAGQPGHRPQKRRAAGRRDPAKGTETANEAQLLIPGTTDPPKPK